MSRRKVMIYVQHLLGIGHIRRASVIAKAVAAAGHDCVFVSGGLPQPDLDLGGARLEQLPPAYCRDERFELLDEAGEPIGEAWKEERRARLLALYEHERPDALLIEQFPFGRRALRFELLPLLDRASADRASGNSPRPRIYGSIRDVLARRFAPDKERWVLETIERYFDAILVHGDPAFIPFGTSFPAADRIKDRLRYTGYVVAGEGPPEGVEPSGEVLVSTGGGTVGGPLMEAALAARKLSPLAEAPWRILAGHGYPEEDFQRLRGKAEEGVIVERARPDFDRLLAACRLSVSLAGYNTTLEVLQTGVPAVLLPYAAGEEGEQLLRARLLAERGLVTLLPPDELSPERLASAIGEAMARGAPAPGRLDCRGAATAASILTGAILAGAS
ncbi:MAG: glycosyltransferase [Limibacillus sp.]